MIDKKKVDKEKSQDFNIAHRISVKEYKCIIT